MLEGIKSKMNSLKETVYSTACGVYATTKVNLRPNENMVAKGYKWFGNIREERDGGGVGILIKGQLINGITIKPITANNKEILLLTYLHCVIYLISSIVICIFTIDLFIVIGNLNVKIFYGKQESHKNKEEAIAEFKIMQTITKHYQNQQYQTLLIVDFNAKIGSNEKGIQNGEKLRD